MRFREMPAALRWYVAVTIGLSTAGILAAGVRSSEVVSPALALAMAAAAFVGSRKLVLVGTPGQPGERVHLMSTLSLGFAIVQIALLWFGPEGGMAVGVASGVGAGLYPRRHSLHRLWFTSATLGATALLVGFLIRALGQESGLDARVQLLPWIAGTVVYYFCNTASVAIAVALGQGASLLKTWRQGYLWTAPSFLAGALIVAAAQEVHRHLGPAMAAMSIACLYLVHLSYRSYLEKVHQLQVSEQRLEEVCMSTVASLSFAISARDGVSHGHNHRAQQIALALAERLRLPQDQLQALRVASLTHDVGKLAVPETILYKAGPLTAEEFERAKTHVLISVGILEPIRFPWPVIEIVRAHHERWDGGGYPEGLKGEAIPLGGRIMAIADVFDTLTTDRPYRRAVSFRDAAMEIRAGSGTHFDPRLVETFSTVLPDLIVAWQEWEAAAGAVLPETGIDSRPEIWATIHGASRESLSLAFTDNLTGLANGRHLAAALPRELETARRGARPLSLVVMDLDGFKAINDTFGHHAGDEALQLVARVLIAELRQGTTLCRNGGDEFVLLLPDTSAEQAKSVVERLRERVGESIVPATNRRIGMSAGIATFPDDADAAAALTEAADHAMYADKAARREREPSRVA